MKKSKENEVLQLQEDHQRNGKYADPLKSILYLYGEHDSGKSTTLGWLAFYLAYATSDESFIDEQFHQWVKELKTKTRRKVTFPDFRAIIPYDVNETISYVYISLFGDLLSATEANVFFFEGRLDDKKILLFDKSSGPRKLNDNERDYYNLFPPSVCISASFQDRKIEEPLWYFAGKKHFTTCMTNWIYMPKAPKVNIGDFKKKYKDYAKLLKRLIDESLKV